MGSPRKGRPMWFGHDGEMPVDARMSTNAYAFLDYILRPGT